LEHPDIDNYPRILGIPRGKNRPTTTQPRTGLRGASLPMAILAKQVTPWGWLSMAGMFSNQDWSEGREGAMARPKT